MGSRVQQLVSVLTLGMLALSLGGCEKAGPAEKAGKEIDKAINSAEGQIQSIGKEIENAVK